MFLSVHMHVQVLIFYLNKIVFGYIVVGSMASYDYDPVD